MSISKVLSAHNVVNSATGGFLHPLTGLDHMIAMISVGILSTQIGGLAVWYVPGTFVLSMSAGGFLGIQGVNIPLVEYGIIFSIVALGTMIFLTNKSPLIFTMAFVSLFGMLHGHAHGTEIPNLSEPLGFFLGFIIATVGLHIAGVILGLIYRRSEAQLKIFRWTGAVIVFSGIAFILWNVIK